MKKHAASTIIQAVIFLVFLAPAFVLAEMPVCYVSSWGNPGSALGDFNNTGLICSDSSGKIYVADIGNNRIQIFDSLGGSAFEFGISGGGNGEFANPQGVAVDSVGNIYVADTDNNRIQKFDLAGNYDRSWGGTGNGNGQFLQPKGITVRTPGDTIYVADTGNNRIQRFTSNGNFVSQWGGAGTNPGQFNAPIGITTDNLGNILVADSGNNRIQKFSPTGAIITEWGSTGGSNGFFVKPVGIACDNTGNVYVADNMNNRIQKFDNNGVFLTSWDNGLLNQPYGVAAGIGGNVYVTEEFGFSVKYYNLCPSATNTPTFTRTATVTMTVTNTPTVTMTPTACNAGSFGYTNIGFSSGTGTGAVYANRFELMQNAYVTGLNIYISSGTGRLRAGIYGDAGGNPNILIAESAAQESAIGWNRFDIPDQALSPGFYWLAFQIEIDARVNYDPGNLSDGLAAGSSFGTFVSPFPVIGRINLTNKASMYADYCPQSGSLVTATITPTVTPVYTATPDLTGMPLPEEGDSYTYPQPAQNSVTIVFSLDSSAGVKINVFNFARKNVLTVEQNCAAGPAVSAAVDTSALSSGVYYYTIKGNYDTGGALKFKPNKFIVAK